MGLIFLYGRKWLIVKTYFHDTKLTVTFTDSEYIHLHRPPCVWAEISRFLIILIGLVFANTRHYFHQSLARLMPIKPEMFQNFTAA